MSKRSSFQFRLGVVLCGGTLAMALLASGLSAWHAAGSLGERVREEGVELAASLARQSRFALLTRAPDNAEAAVATVYGFPGIAYAGVLDDEGRVLLEAGRLNELELFEQSASFGQRAIAHETPALLVFIAPVSVQEHRGASDGLHGGQGAPATSQHLGRAVVAVSKREISALTRDTFVEAFGTSLLIGLLITAALLLTSRQLVAPIGRLAHAMAKESEIGRDQPIPAVAPREVARIIEAFNAMRERIRERDSALRESAALLEGKVAERTRELHVARDEAVRAADAKTRFLANVSHELRTPLNSIIALTHFLVHVPPGPKRGEYLDQLRSSATHLEGLITDIIDLARLETGAAPARGEGVHVAHLLRAVADIVAPQAEAKSLLVSFSVAADVPGTVVTDGTRLRQALLILASNAVKFTEAGAVRLECRSSGHGPQRLRFDVRDTGRGVDPAVRQQLFEPFFKAPSKESTNTTGYGLGLAICAGIVEQLGGNLGVEANDEEGSCFWLEVPVKPAPSDPRVGDGGRGLHTVLAEDDATARFVYREILEGLGHWPTVVHNGNDMLAHKDDPTVDLLICDYRMPDLCGVDSLRRWREEARNADVPAIIITADATAETIRTCQDVADLVLTKPFPPEALGHAIEQVVRAPQPRADISVAESPGAARAQETHVVDASRVHGLIRHLEKPETMRSHVARFDDELGKTIEAAVAALHQGDLAQFRALLHRQKSAAGMLGATRLTQRLQRYHDADDDELLRDDQQIGETLRREAAIACEALHGLLESDSHL